MAKCDQGYLCQVCGGEVSRLIDSSLYLQFVIGWIPADQLQQHPDIHLKCNPNLSQFIDAPEFFEPMIAEGPFDRRQLDTSFVSQRTALITQGYLRLRHLQRDRSLPIEKYPLDGQG